VEAFSAGRVPDLHLDLLAVDVQVLNREVDPDRCDVLRVEHVVAQARPDVGFAHTHVPD
jgi:hypothetical protein